MSLKLPNDKIVYNLPEQVGVNTENIKYLAEVYKDIDSIPAQFADVKTYFDDVMTPAFAGWTTTFQGWTNTLDTYLANMSSAALGAIANGTVAGNFAVSGSFTADSIIENMTGYTFVKFTPSTLAYNYKYVGVVKTGNKITFVVYLEATPNTTINVGVTLPLGTFNVPSAVGAKLYPSTIAGLNNVLSYKKTNILNSSNGTFSSAKEIVYKTTATALEFDLSVTEALSANVPYLLRIEITFLLSDSLVS